MKERAVTYHGAVPLAILNGTKNTTRFPLTHIASVGPVTDLRASDAIGFDWEALSRRNFWYRFGDSDLVGRCPVGAPGSRLWVRERWAMPPGYDPERHGDLTSPPSLGPVAYKADYAQWEPWKGTKWRGAGTMPRWASRITLEITGVRVERVQDITEEEARAEGVAPGEDSEGGSCFALGFVDHWDSLHARAGQGWDANPWVWVVRHRVVARPVAPWDTGAPPEGL